MYRTYRELYRGKIEIVAIGEGAGKIRLPRGMALGLDAAILGLIGVFVPGLPLGWVVSWFIPLPPFITALIIGVTVGGIASRFDPQGKSVIRWLQDYLAYLVRPHRHDGWKGIPKTQHLNLTTQVYGVDQGVACSTPIRGTGNTIVLHKRMGVQLLKNGEWIVERSRKPIQEGRYRIKNGKLVMDIAPVVRRK